MTATLQGFARAEKEAIVALGKTATSDFRLGPATTAEIVVTGQAPLIDEASTTIGNNIANRQINSLPTGRSYTSVAQISTGVSTQTTNTANFANTMVINGSTGLENGFVIDGVVTNGVEYGAQGKDLNYEFIQELEVKTGGYQAEYGRSTGGIINVITKSGGNEFHGDAFVYYDNDSLQAGNKHPEDSNLFSFTSGYNRLDYGFDLGGYVLKDRLWFFGAYDRVENTIKRTVTDGPETGRPANTDTNRNLGSAKLTWMIGGSHTLVGSYFQDPRADDGSNPDGIRSENGPYPTFIGEQGLGGSDYSLRYTGLFGASWAVTAQGAVHHEKNNVNPSLPGGDDIQYVDTINNLQSGRLRPDPGKELHAVHGRGLRHEVPGDERDQGRRRVPRGPGRRHQADVGRPAGHDLRESRQSEPAGLLPLLLDDPDGEPAGQRADLAAERHAVPAGLVVLPAGHR